MFPRITQRSFATYLALITAFCLLGALLLLHPTITHAQSQPEALGSISGTVRDAQGDPLPNISVSIPQYPYGGNTPFRIDTTDAEGKYQLLSLPPGGYRVRFADPDKSYATTYYSNKAMWSDANLVNVTGNHVTGIDAELTQGGSISITTNVVITPNGSSLNLTLYGKKTSGLWELYDVLNWPYTSQELAFYGLPAGRYRLCGEAYLPDIPLFESECYDNATFNYNGSPAENATDIVVNAGEQQTITLEFGNVGQLQGTVQSSTGRPIANAEVLISTEDNLSSILVTADANGHFRFAQLYDGTYTLRATDIRAEYLQTYYDGAASVDTAKRIEIVSTSRYSITVVMQPSGHITGKVRAQGGGVPAYASILAYRAMPDGSWDESLGACAQGQCGYFYEPSTGVYTVTGVTTGKYRVMASEWVNNQNIYAFYGGHNFQTADDVLVTTGQTTTGIDITMGVGRFDGTIMGSARANGTPKSGIEVGLFVHNDWGPGQRVVATTTDSQGNYRFDGLFSGHYDVGFRDPQGDYATTFYGAGVFSPTAVIITGAFTIDDINVDLTLGGTLRGKIIRAAGKSSVEFRLQVGLGNQYLYFPYVDVLTDANGDYTITGLPPGSYWIGASGPYCCPDGPSFRFYPFGVDINEAKRVEVAENVVVNGIDIYFDMMPRAYLPFIGDSGQASE